MVEEKIELKPCPFCGGKAVIVDRFCDCVAVACTTCRASTIAIEISKTYNADEKAAEVWNRRVMGYGGLGKRSGN